MSRGIDKPRKLKAEMRPRILTTNLRTVLASPPLRPYKSFNRPAPQPLGDKDAQKEFQDLVRRGEEATSRDGDEEALHPDVRRRPRPDFEGDTNPATGEKGGPKVEPVKVYVEGDWSFGGRVTDF